MNADGAVRAGPAHAAAMAAIHAEAFPPAGRWSADVFAAQLSMPGVFGWIDAAGGMILARVMADEAEVLTLAVAPWARRGGLARRLLALAMRTAGEQGAASLVLEVGAGNRAAQALYAQAGFVQGGLRRAYYAGGEDALILRAALCG